MPTVEPGAALVNVETAQPGQLKRSMKMFGNLMLTLSAITPASSVFVIVPGIVVISGSGAFLSMVLGACVCVTMAFVYAELGSAFPFAGGEYAFVGRVVGPAAGLITMGVNTVGQILSAAIFALGISNYLSGLFPHVPVVSTAIITIALATGISILTVRINAVVTGIFLAIEVLALIVLAVLGFLHVDRSLADLILHPVMLDQGKTSLVSTPFVMIALGSSVALYAYTGYGGAVNFGEETDDAQRQVARAVLWSLAVTVLIELVPLTAVLLGAPDLKALLGSANLFGDFITMRGSSVLNTVVSLGVALAIFNAIIAGQLVTARILFSTGRDRVWPTAISRAPARTHKRFHSPWVAALACGLFAALACLVNETVLLVMTGAAVTLTYTLMCVAALLGRWQKSTDHGHYRMPSFPLAPNRTHSTSAVIG
jgi:amino acid transporter